MPATVGISLLKLRLAMAGVWFAVFGAAALVLTAIVLYLGLSVVYVYGVIVFVLVLNLIQWLFGPYLINA
ncbi:MAG: protease HtpX, partial [Aigarchaeota archaeon]|nr:protease HtpX [Aigarchaeota archaeon]